MGMRCARSPREFCGKKACEKATQPVIRKIPAVSRIYAASAVNRIYAVSAVNFIYAASAVRLPLISTKTCAVSVFSCFYGKAYCNNSISSVQTIARKRKSSSCGMFCDRTGPGRRVNSIQPYGEYSPLLFSACKSVFIKGTLVLVLLVQILDLHRTVRCGMLNWQNTDDWSVYHDRSCATL